MRPAPTRRHGFTLLELIISVALVLVLMLAITKIFSITSTTIGASQGIAAATRDARAAQAVFQHDIGSMAGDTPFIWIRYDGYVPAFRNADDLRSDRDYVDATNANGDSNAAQNGHKLTIDLDGDGVDGEMTVTGENLGTLALSSRNHRQDRFSFCARDRFLRQTGNTAQNQLVSTISSSEAWITYGHVVLPRLDGGFNLINPGNGSAKTNPGSGVPQNNPSNYYASQWTLGRTALLMVLPSGAPSGTPASETITDVDGVEQEYYGRTQTASWVATANNNNMTPLSGATVGHPPYGSVRMQDARYDLVGIDIANAKDRIERFTAAGANNWWTELPTSRNEVNPFVIKPISALTASHQVPIFLPACSQFVVEYAGDFVSQLTDGSLDTTASMGGLSPDGKIDFIYVAATGERRIQWFGYPRSITGGDTADAGSGDTLLLGDFVGYISGTGALTAASKKNYKQFSDFALLNPDFAAWEHYGTATTPTGSSNNRSAIRFVDSRPFSNQISTLYVAWGPDSIDNPNIPRPKMYRITLAIDRPELAGRSADAQTFEYVFTVP